MTNKETQISIRVSGLLQAIIHSGKFNTREWEETLQFALSLHSKTCKTLLAGPQKKETACAAAT